MNRRLTILSFFILILIPIASNHVFADTITDANDIPELSKTVDFSQFIGDLTAVCPGIFDFGFCFTNGPIQVGDLVSEDIEWSSTTTESVIGNGHYSIGTNRVWTSERNGYVGTNEGESTVVMRFDFNNAPVCAVGGFVNYAPGNGDPFVMRALSSGNAVLETFNISNDAPISTPTNDNDGAFRGIIRTSNDIAAIELAGEFDVLDDLKFSRNCQIVMVGGDLLPIDSTALLLASAQSTSWIIPVLLSGIGIGLFIVSRTQRK